MALKHEKIYLTNTEKDMVRRVVKWLWGLHEEWAGGSRKLAQKAKLDPLGNNVWQRGKLPGGGDIIVKRFGNNIDNFKCLIANIHSVEYKRTFCFSNDEKICYTIKW
jgi:hypothetical protein